MVGESVSQSCCPVNSEKLKSLSSVSGPLFAACNPYSLFLFPVSVQLSYLIKPHLSLQLVSLNGMTFNILYVCVCVFLLSVTPRVQSKVRELEEKCRSQSEQFGLLSQELEKFRLQASKVDLASTSLLNNPSLSALTNGVGLTTDRGEPHYPVMDLHTKINPREYKCLV